jgi:hypothetical protein
VLDFPATPGNGQIYSPPSGFQTFNYATNKWRQERAWVHLQRQRNVTSGAGLALAYPVLPAGYNFFKLILRRWEPVPAVGMAVFRVSADGGSTFPAAAGTFAWEGMYQLGTGAQARWFQDSWTAGSTYFPLGANTQVIANNGGPNMYDIEIDPGAAGLSPAFNVHSITYQTANGMIHSMLSGHAGTGARLTHLQLFYYDYPPAVAIQSTCGGWDLFGAP